MNIGKEKEAFVAEPLEVPEAPERVELPEREEVPALVADSRYQRELRPEADVLEVS